MKTLTVAEFVTILRALPAAVKHAERRGLEKGAKLIEQEAKDLIGTERPEWAPLAYSTLYGGVSPEGHRYPGKIALGQVGRISATDPLYATGEMRATLGHTVDGDTALIGTADPVAVFQEFGTSRMPPRPFLAAAGHRKGEDAANAIGKEVYHALAGLPPPPDAT